MTIMSHHVPGPPDYDVVMTEQVPGLNGPKMLGRHKPTAPTVNFLFNLSSRPDVRIIKTNMTIAR